MHSTSFVHVNQSESTTSSSFGPKTFTLSAASKTDIYCSPLPPSSYVFNAPIVYQKLQKTSFRSARLSLSFHASIQFDQAGLLFAIPTKSNPLADAQNSTTAESHPAWIKAGIEANDGKAWISVVARAPDAWCDWSLVPIPESRELPADAAVTIEVTRYKNALMIWTIEGKERTLIRKVPWAFLDDGMESIWIGAYAARPDPNAEASKELNVEFRDFTIDLAN